MYESAHSNIGYQHMPMYECADAHSYISMCRYMMGMPMNMYDYMLPGKCGRKFKTGYHTPETYKNNLGQRIMHAESNIPTSLLTKISFFSQKLFSFATVHIISC